MSSHSSRVSSSKKVSIIYNDSPRTSYDSLASRSSSANDTRYSADIMSSTTSTQGSNSTRYNAGSSFSGSSYGSNAVDRLVRDPNPSKSTQHGYYATERLHSSGTKVTVHNHGKRSFRGDEPRTTSYKR